MTPVGIDRLHVWPSTMALAMPDLCAARGHDPADIRDVMMVDERSVCPPWEDPVTMAVNAALPLMSEENRREIDLLLVASESGVDQEKPLSTWVHRHLGLQPACRNLEVKHACYGGTGALALAAGYLASPLAGPRSKALVVTTDMSRMHLGKPWEYVMGASAVALLVTREPRLFELEPGRSGVYTNEVSDLTRPTSRVETGNSETSLLSYLDALDHALAAYLSRVGEPVGYDHFAKNVYHAPFGGMTLRATRAALRHFGAATKSEAQRVWEEKTKPSLAYVRRMGGTYAASTFIELLALVDRCDDLRPRDRVGMFSYGSGSCAELYSGLVGPKARATASEAGLAALLDARHRCTVAEYEEAERHRTEHVDCGDYEPSTKGFGDLYDRRYRSERLLVFRGAREHYRRYEWSMP